MLLWRGGIGTYLFSQFLLLSQLVPVCFRQIFPNYSSARRPICKNSALARIKEKRAELKAIGLNGQQA